MRKIAKPLLVLLLSLTMLMATTASAWAAPGGRHWWFGGGNNPFNIIFNNRFSWNNHNRGNQNFANRWQQDNQYGWSGGGNEMPFTDVPGWAKKQVAQMYGLGLIKGIGKGLFGSNRLLTRAQFAVLLDREFGLSTSQTGNTVTFADVPAGSYYYPYIEAAAPYMDYWNGPNGTYLFHPQAPATREDVIASLVEAAGLANQSVDTSVLSKFADAGSISSNLTNLVAIAVQEGLVTGSENRSGIWHLYPRQPLTRAEAAALLDRALAYSVVAPGGTTGLTGSSDTVRLSAAVSVTTVGQQVTVSATVLNSSGQILADVPVTFSVNGSATLGSGTVYTNSSGIAQTTLTDATAQTVTVTASAEGVSASTTVQFNAITANGSIELSYSPQPVYAGQQAVVSATVLNASGQILAGVPVTFNVNGSAALGSGTVYTNSSGIAQTTLTDATAQTVTVTASAEGMSVSTTIQFNAAATTAASIKVSYSPQPVYAGQQAVVSATVLNASGQILAGVPVTFSVNGSATLGSGTVYTNSSGIAQTTLTDATAQIVTVTAASTGASAWTTVQFDAAAATAASIELSYSPHPVYAGQQATVSATVLNASGQILADVPVTFSVNGSATLGSGTVYTNSSGIAQTTLTDATAQTVTVTAATTGVSASTTVQFDAAATTAASIELSYSPQPVYAGQQAVVSVTVLNSSGQILAGVPVTFSVNGSATLGSGTVYTNSNGIAQTTLTDATAQIVTVTAASTGASAWTTIQFNAAATTAASIRLSYSPQPVYAGQQAVVSATVLNSSGQILAGVPVTFSVNGSAALGSGTVYTNSSGIAQTTLTDATAQLVTVTAATTGVSASTTVQFDAAATTARIELSYSPHPATVGQTITVSATVLNSSGQILAGVPVTFSVNGSAALGSGTVYTNSSGIAQTTLTDATAQLVTITAAATGVSTSTTVEFDAA